MDKKNSIELNQILRKHERRIKKGAALRKYYGWFGLSIFAGMLCCAFFSVRYLNKWVTPLGWYGYIFFMDWLIFRKEKASLLTVNIKEFFIMLPFSIVLWCVFEAHNMYFNNWEYVGLYKNIILDNLGFALAFSTILPAIYETSEFLRSRKVFAAFKIVPQEYSKTRLFLEIAFGLGLISLTLIFPSIYSGMLIWPGYYFVFSPLNHLLGIQSVFKERSGGKISETLNLMLAGYICGFVWELLNFWAAIKWVYHIPYFSGVRIFEMPLLGFLGFGPFALAFIEMYRFVKQICFLRHRI